ncbi:MAG: beta-galactosidase, partial [Planctomycetota bacterium]
PYTGLAYKDDPALAIVEVHNEDCIFWHAPLNDLASYNNGRLDRHAAILGTMWMNWVKDRYSNDTNLRAAWGNGWRSGDSVNNPTMKMYGAWEMDGDGPRSNKNREKKRMGDFIRFLAEFQRDYYERRAQRLRELGYKAVTVTTAWKAGGPAASAANLWADDAMDAIDRHNYFGGGAGGHGITAGSVSNDTHMNKAGRAILSSGFWQVEDKPFIMTEWTQKPPNQWKAELAPLFAFYGMGLQGWDASYHFAASRSYMGNGWPSMRSYVTCTPHYIGQFPALACAIYNNHFDEGDIISARRLSTSDIFAGIDKLQQEYGLVGYDENELLAHGSTPVEALAAGRVTLKVMDRQGPSYLGDLSTCWNRRARTVQSNTGQLTWDYGSKVVTVHSDKTQGVIGFAGGGTYELPGVSVEVGPTPFISLLFTPLDNRALIESEHVLITALAQDKQYGTVYNEDGTTLIETGGPPLLLEPVQATLTFKGAPLTSVKVVDVYGVPAARHVERTGNAFAIDGRYATYYYEVKRSAE